VAAFKRGNAEAAESVDGLLRRIAKLGIRRSYLTKIVPQWERYPPSSPTEMLELKVHLVRELGLDLKSLEQGRPVDFRALPSAPRFKSSRKVQPERLSAATALFFSLAKAAAAGVKVPYRPLPSDPLLVRQELLAAGSSSIGLGALVEYLWKHGIPVVHYSDFPPQLGRPAAIVVDVDGRPVIVIGSAKRENAWLLFYVAHECGHIARGHLSRSEMIVDVDEPEIRQVQQDPEEREADEFALTVLGGKQVELPDFRLSVSALASAVRSLGQRQRIDPGHLVLRHAMATGDWAGATMALQDLEQGANAPLLINGDFAAEAIDLSEMAEDRRAFLKRVLALP
jgi:hypothetical protein